MNSKRAHRVARVGNRLVRRADMPTATGELVLSTAVAVGPFSRRAYLAGAPTRLVRPGTPGPDPGRTSSEAEGLRAV